MDATNRMLLDRVQRSFPLVREPYAALAEGLGIDGQEVRERIEALKHEKLVRQISGIFNTGALGYRSSLIAMAVSEERIESAAQVINEYPGVSHNYLRQDHYNLWFTIAVPPGESLEETVAALSNRAGGWDTLILPALRKYKLAVVLDVLEEGDGEAIEDSSGNAVLEPSTLFPMSPDTIRVVRCVQEDLPLVERPFRLWADSLRMGEDELLELISTWITKGYLRRFAAVLNHRQVGFRANGMVVWRCPEESLDSLGRAIAAHQEVSHCYFRPEYADWPYNLYAMVHARSMEECRKVAEDIGAEIGIVDHRILFSTREFKKIRLKLFWD